MRQVNQDVIEAYAYGSKCKNIGGNTQVQHGADGSKRCVLHNTIIAYERNGLVHLNHGGWLTRVTYDRLSALAESYGWSMSGDGLGFYVTTSQDIYKLPCVLSKGE